MMNQDVPFAYQIRRINACHAARHWLEISEFETLEEMWNAIDNPTWMIWLVARCVESRDSRVNLTRMIIELSKNLSHHHHIEAIHSVLNAWCDASIDDKEAQRELKMIAFGASGIYSVDMVTSLYIDDLIKGEFLFLAKSCEALVSIFTEYGLSNSDAVEIIRHHQKTPPDIHSVSHINGH